MGKAKINIPICAALVLLLLTMISVHMTSGLYARYTATAMASDSARVAKFDVKSDLQPVNGEEGKFTLTVNNGSEVTVSYRVDIVFNESLKEVLENGKLSITLDDKAGIWKEDTLTLSFGTVATLKYEAVPNVHDLVFDVLDWTFVTNVRDDTEITKLLAFTVNVTAEQVD